MANHAFLEKITTVPGISGYEKNVAEVFEDYLTGCVDSFEHDRLGSVVAIKKGKTPLKVMLAGHIDGIGFMVKDIDKDGFIQVQPIGGWQGKNIPAGLFEIITRDQKHIRGVMEGSTKVKGPEARNMAPLPTDVFLDIGVQNLEQVKEAGVRIGDPIIPVSEFSVMTHPRYLMSKAWDDRAGVAVIAEVMRNLKDVETEATIYAAGTGQGGVGLRGAKTMGQMVQPDVAFALDVCFSKDIPEGEKGDVRLGCGAVLGVLDGSVIAHTGLLKHMEKICAKLGVSYQLDVLVGGGTDSGELSKVGPGVVNMTLSIPSRYMHSHRTITCEDDLDATVPILTEFRRTINAEILEEIKRDKQ